MRKPHFDSTVREGLRGLVLRVEPRSLPEWEAHAWIVGMAAWYDHRQRQRQDGGSGVTSSSPVAPCGEEGRKPLPPCGGCEKPTHTKGASE